MSKLNLYKMNEEEMFKICNDCYNLYKETDKKVDDLLFAEYGLFALVEKKWGDVEDPLENKLAKIKLSENSNEEFTLQEFREYVLKNALDKFWYALDCNTRLSFLFSFPTSQCKAIHSGLMNAVNFQQQEDVNTSKNELMIESLNYFYVTMKLIHDNEESSGYSIFQKLIRHRIYDGEDFKFTKVVNNFMQINPAISLSENQKILRKKYKELEIVKFNEIKNIEELYEKLRLYIVLYVLRENYNLTFGKIDEEISELIEGFDMENKEDFLKKIYKRKILEIIKLFEKET